MRRPSQPNIVNREALVQKNRTLLATARRRVESGIKMLSPNLENSRQLKYNALFRVSPKAVPIRPRLHLKATQVVQGKSRLKHRWQNCSPILVWEELKLRSTGRFRLGAGRRAWVPPLHELNSCTLAERANQSTGCKINTKSAS
jgi:hypothetical protein